VVTTNATRVVSVLAGIGAVRGDTNLSLHRLTRMNSITFPRQAWAAHLQLGWIGATTRDIVTNAKRTGHRGCA
jgi:diphthamide biosynthesis methyltransferase